MMRAKDNPFRTERLLTIRYRPIGESWETLWNRLVAMDFRAAIVGPEGSGKTTLLEDLQERIEASGRSTLFLRLDATRQRLDDCQWAALREACRDGGIILLDGAEQLSRWNWLRFRRFTRRGGGLIATAHRPINLPTLTTCHTTPALLEQIVMDLGQPCPEPHDLFARHRGNLRTALRELYDTASAIKRADTSS